VREEMSQLMNEAERRHHIATRYQNEASEMRLGILEQQAERRHLEVVAKLERNISSIEVRAADRGKYLVAELQSLQEQNMAMQRDHAANISIAEAIQAHRLQVTYTNEMAEFARTNQEFLSEEFAQNLTIFRKEVQQPLNQKEHPVSPRYVHIPDEVTLKDILLRQIRKSVRMKYDLEIHDRAKEETKEHTSQFLVQSIKDLLTRERMRKNRDRIAKSHGEKYGAPAPAKPDSTRPPVAGRAR
ncbi:GIP, partial [Symbiodinium pilosum]